MDFFTLLEVMATVHAGRQRIPLDAPTLLGSLREEIAAGLQREVERLGVGETPHLKWADSANRPDVVVTSNWDTLSERAADEAGLEVRFRWPRKRTDELARRDELRQNEIVILKLHGSADWGQYADRQVTDTPLSDYYSDLSTPLWGTSAFGRARKPSNLVLRFGSIEGARAAGAGTVGFAPPLMATMAVGKQAQIDALDEIWDDAYWCISRANVLDLVGYSFPSDDLELRTLFRTGTRRAGRADLDEGVVATVVNPAPEAHERARLFFGAGVRSDYKGAEAWAPPD